MADKTWKAVERAVARQLGGQRISNHALGRQTPDVECDHLSVEVKHRAALPRWLVGAVEQAVANATPGNVPVVVLHEKGRRHADDLVVVRLRDFVDRDVGL